MATSKRDRFFAMFGALLFLGTSSALTIAVVLSTINENKQSNSNTSQTKEGNKLQGTQLANFTPVTKIEKLEVSDSEVGKGEEVQPGATVTAHYTGAVAATGTIFQSSKDFGQPISFDLKQVIAGWSQGIPGMKVGGTRRLFIPAALAYGPHPPQGSGIPADADLVFDVTIVKVN